MNINEKIKEIRLSKGISQTVVADACGIKQSSFFNIESGKTQNITIEIGKGIAKALDISFTELFDIESPVLDIELIEKLQSENEALKKQLANYEVLIELMKDKLQQ